MPETGVLNSPLLRDLKLRYAPRGGVFDELLGADGLVRAPWERFVKELGALEEDEYAHRLNSARGMVRDNGVTYNVYDDAGGEMRPWDLDILPLLLSASDWAVLERGVMQRAQLANALLADLYGPKTMIARGVLPPHLVTGHPQFLRPMEGIAPPGGVYVHFLSVDVARASNGTWIVLGQWVDAPTGAGYALENRIVVSQTFPELFRDLNVKRLAAFFHAYREAVTGLANAARPRSVLLTPGPFNEAYFEHAYLARYLHLALVEGDDLLMHDGALYLKALSGLERVDVLFRRVDSDFCDPLELRSDSALGVPGLVEVARTGKTVIANALGGSVAEAPALAGFEADLCRALLGEDPLLASVPTSWCGTETGRQSVLADLGNLVIRHAFDAAPLFAKGSTARLGAEMSASEQGKLADLLTRRGASFVAQKVAPLGTAPIYENGGLAPKPVALRLFAAWTPGGYVVMPGGLARVARDESLRSLSMQSGAASKDIWVLSDGPVDRFSLLKPQHETVPIRRTGDEAPSRAMDNLFWLGRYAERAENLVRVARAVLLRLGDDTGFDETANAADLARRLLVPLGQASEAAAAAAADGNVLGLTQQLQALVFDRAHPAGLQRMLQNVKRTAWSVRDRLSIDTWRTTLAFTAPEPLYTADSPLDPAGARGHLDALVRRGAALSGLAAENMTRGPNWLFLELGRRIERTENTTWLVRQDFGAEEAQEESRLPLMLEIADSAMTYRSRYLGALQAAPVLDLLLLDESNPRAVAFQIETIKAHIEELPRGNTVQLGAPDKEVIAALLSKLWAIDDPQALAEADERGARGQLIRFLDYVDQAAADLSTAIARTYFQQTVRRRAGFAPRREMR
jgi:uncharacterized circularly permuted ATP-grasp superfamily protein/uncharacterized alpha-E superfamily protein